MHMKKEKLKQNEQGRSMVEMLGVLAIVGVLSVGGFAALKIALNKYYANQTINRLMRRAMTVSSQRLLGQTVSLNDYTPNDGKYMIVLLNPTDNESFTMQVDNVPQAVCQQIIEAKWNIPKIIPEDCSDTSMKFKFLNDLTDCSDCVADSVSCPPANEIECGSCSVVRGFVDNNADCEGNENGEYCVRGKCSMCSKGTYANNSNNCVPCIDDGNYYTAASELYKHHCLETMFYRLTYHKQIFSCSYSNTINTVDELSCKACANRCYHQNRNLCRNLETGEAGLKRNADGICECQPEYYMNKSNAICQLCVDDGNIYDNATPESKHNCLKKMYFRTSHDQMIACSWTGNTTYGADERSCKECDNRCYDNGTCRLMGDSYDKDANDNCVEK